MRWSARKRIDEVVLELQHLTPEQQLRPVDIKVLDIDPNTGATETLLSQLLPNADVAVARLKEFSSSLAAAQGGGSFQSQGSQGSATSPPRGVSATGSASFCSSTAQGGAISEVPPPLERQDSSKNLAGMLEKQSYWRKEWGYRFFVMRQDRIDYYLTPPALLEEEDSSSRKGFVRLTEAVAARDPDESGRAYCISVGNELLSCSGLAEQQRWLETINVAAAALARSRLPPESPGEVLLTSLKMSKLLLVPTEAAEDVTPLQWQKPSLLFISGKDNAATLLFKAPSGSVEAVCRLPLFDVAAGSSSREPVHWISETEHNRNTDFHVRVRVHENRLKGPTEAFKFSSLTMIACVLAVALILRDSTYRASCALLAVCALVFYGSRQEPVLPRRHIKFSVEQVEAGSGDAVAVLASTPKWVGKWALDKSCSEPYAPILEDLGVNFLLRKAADAANPVMTITTTNSHVSLHVKMIVVVQESIPLDGTMSTKPVPPGSKMSGNCKVKINKVTDTALEMETFFPDGNGGLQDILTMNEDGNSFTRVVIRGKIKVTRVFRKQTAL